MLDRFEELSRTLLEQASEQQKEKLEPILKKARQRLEEAKLALAEAGANRARIARTLRQTLAELLDELQNVLTPEQFEKLKARFPFLAGLENRFTQLRRDLARLGDLTDQQKEKLRQLQTEMQGKFDKLLEQTQGDRQALMQNTRELTRELRTKIQEILNPDQQQRLRDMIRRDRSAGRPETRPAE